MIAIRPLRSLQARLLAWVLGLVIALWGAALAYTWLEARHEIDELLDSHLAQSAALLLAQQWPADLAMGRPPAVAVPDERPVRERDRREPGVRGEHAERGEQGEQGEQGDARDHRAGHHDRDDHRHRIETPLLHRYAQRTAFQVWHEGRLVMRSANAPATPLGGHRSGFETVRLDGAPWRVFATRGAEDDVRVYVAEQTGSRRSILQAVVRGLLLPMALTLPLLALAVWWAVRRGLLPLRRLRAAVAARQPQALEPLELAEAPTEMTPLVAELNRLFGRIGALLEGERRFTADAAHELRTPIAAIRAQAQAALGAGGDSAGREHALRATLAGCDRAAHLVEQLLTLSRLEGGAAQPPALVDLASLARQVLADSAPAALAREQEVELRAPAPVPMQGHEALLAVLLRNLVDNAVRYSPRGARVRVTVAAGELAVEDSGPGVPQAERARLGERFFRVLGSGESGSGLGLSIVQRIAEAHGARVTIDVSPELGGLRVRMRGKP